MPLRGALWQRFGLGCTRDTPSIAGHTADLRGTHVLGAHTHSDQSRWEAPQKGQGRQ